MFCLQTGTPARALEKDFIQLSRETVDIKSGKGKKQNKTIKEIRKIV